MHVTITAHLDSPVIGELTPLDGALSWAAYQLETQAGRAIPPITDDHAHDFDLPLEKWERNGYWGWCVSNPITNPAHYSAAEFRRKPPTGAMALYTQAKDHHAALGQLKARNTTLATTHHTHITWHAHTTDHDALLNHLTIITHLGARHRNGFGHITHWDITPGTTDAWKNRPLPTTTGGTTMRVRAPYWHPTERTPCS